MNCDIKKTTDPSFFISNKPKKEKDRDYFSPYYSDSCMYSFNQIYGTFEHIYYKQKKQN